MMQAPGALMQAPGDAEAFSVFVGDISPDVNDFLLQETFRQYYPTVRSAKVRPRCGSRCCRQLLLPGSRIWAASRGSLPGPGRIVRLPTFRPRPACRDRPRARAPPRAPNPGALTRGRAPALHPLYTPLLSLPR